MRVAWGDAGSSTGLVVSPFGADHALGSQVGDRPGSAKVDFPMARGRRSRTAGAVLSGTGTRACSTPTRALAI